jgi:hypothetical protein
MNIFPVLCIAAAALFTGCAVLPQYHPQPERLNQQPAAHQLQLIDAHGAAYALHTKDNFQHALLISPSGQRYTLYQTLSGSGIRLANDQGVIVHFKSDAGYILLHKDQYIEISVHPE